jgi:hypothetical protein
MKLKNIMLAGALAIALTGTAQAQVAVPNTFTSGQPAVAADVNANFTALVNAINDLAGRVETLEAAPGLTSGAPVAGRYSLISTGTLFYQEGTYVELEDNLARARLEVNSDNTWLLTGDGNRAVEFLHYIEDIGGAPTTSTNFGDGPIYFRMSGSWVRDGSLLTLTATLYELTDTNGNATGSEVVNDVIEMRISHGSVVLLGSDRNAGPLGAGVEHATSVLIAIRVGDEQQ